MEDCTAYSLICQLRNIQSLRALWEILGSASLGSPGCSARLREQQHNNHKHQNIAAQMHHLCYTHKNAITEAEEIRQQIQRSAINMSLRARGRQPAHEYDDSQVCKHRPYNDNVNVLS
ncbi:hypothetical protein SK128_007677 [Halocaridina rubra]|uniref:Uncharacterized protein n=1 Tax=Halocaridina rubra TaxID=373956 RepID=A0AAN8WRR3_HALRR